MSAAYFHALLAGGAGAVFGTVWWFVHCARARRCPFCNKTHGGTP